VEEHEQFEVLVAAILTSGIAGARGCNEPTAIAGLLASMRAAVRETGLITKKSANFIPKAGR